VEPERLPDSDSQSFQLSLRIRHPSMDPAEISRALGIEPEHSFRAGAPRTSGSEIARAFGHKETYWLGVLKPTAEVKRTSFFGDPQWQTLYKQFARLRGSLTWALSLTVGGLSRTHADLLRRIRAEAGEVTLLVTISRELGSFTLPAEISRILGDLGIAVEFELAGG
jgi:hypothetical protein